MKRIKILIITLLVVLTAGFFLWKNVNHTSELDVKAFAIDKPSEITKIYFSPKNKKNPYLIFEKTPEGWNLKNDKQEYVADTHNIHDLLFWLMKKVEVVSPVPDAAKNEVVKDISLNGIEAIFYVGEKEVKRIYVGGPTPSQEANYMYLPGNERPTIVHVPGHNGYLSPYFSTNIQQWRSLALLNIAPLNIKEVLIQWPRNPENSFIIRRNGDEITLYNGEGRKIDCRSNKLSAFLEAFQNVTHEAGEPAGINRNKAVHDSLLSSTPIFSLKIIDIHNKPITLNLYPVSEEMMNHNQVRGLSGLEVYETEQYWANIQGQPEIWVMQDVIMRNRMKKLNNFLR
jgi:uncharacterized protein YxeA